MRGASDQAGSSWRVRAGDGPKAMPARLPWGAAAADACRRPGAQEDDGIEGTSEAGRLGGNSGKLGRVATAARDPRCVICEAMTRHMDHPITCIRSQPHPTWWANCTPPRMATVPPGEEKGEEKGVEKGEKG
jgi:hypothetical protein